MSDRIQATLLQLSDPRKISSLLSLLLFVLALTGCGAPTECPSGGGVGGCGGG